MLSAQLIRTNHAIYVHGSMSFDCTTFNFITQIACKCLDTTQHQIHHATVIQTCLAMILDTMAAPFQMTYFCAALCQRVTTSMRRSFPRCFSRSRTKCFRLILPSRIIDSKRTQHAKHRLDVVLQISEARKSDRVTPFPWAP